MRIAWYLGAATVALALPTAVCAQETTSIIRGSVVDENGTPQAGVRVIVTHVPSGSVSATDTDVDGKFQLAGLRVGGPFKVVVREAGNDIATVTDIFTALGSTFELPIAITQAADVTVTASSIKNSGSTSLGPQTRLGAADIGKVASVNRDVRDVIRRDPFVTSDFNNNRAISFAGINPRFNRFSVNGVGVNDRFGLNSDANPTRRGPIPLDAVGEVTSSIAPVDIRQTGFTGGAIDLVLRAGTNKFEGTGFWSINTDGLSGDAIGSNRLTNDFNNQTYGARVSGPIIKDKLFFEVTGERTTQSLPNTTGPAGEGFAASIPNLTRAQITQIQGIAQSVYNYDTGDVIRSRDEIDEKIVGRIDWNITDGQKFILTYVNAYDSIINPQGSSASTSSPSVGLRSDGYLLTELQRSGQIQLNSDWSDHFSTEIRFGYTSLRRGQDPLLGRGFGQFTVCLDPSQTLNALGGTNTTSVTTCTSGAPRVVFGPDINRQINTQFGDTYNGSFQARLHLGGHDVKFLFDLDRYRNISEILVNGAGAFYFDSIADFQTRRAGTLTLQRPVSGNISDSRYDYLITQYGIGIQDDWAITPTLSVSLGARFDLFDQGGTVALNNNFVARNDFPNTGTLSGLSVFEPRVGFLWKPTPRLSLRGSGGIYQGGTPVVYINNSYANTGVLVNTINLQRTSATGFNTGTPTDVGNAGLSNVDGRTFNSAVLSFLSTNIASLSAAQVNALLPDYQIPQLWRATLSLDYKANLGPLGDGWNFGVNYLFGKQKSQVTFIDVRSVATGLTLPDGRARYNVDPATPGSLNPDIVIGNQSNGTSHIGVVKLSKRWDFGLSIDGSYSRQFVEDRSAAGASVALSNYNSTVYGDPNFPALGTANDETTWQFKYNIGFDRAFFGDYRTVLQLFGETKAGRRYSYTFQDLTSGRSPVFGTIGNNDRYLLYVPLANDPRVSYDTATTQQSLETLITSTKLRDFRGQIAPRNLARSRANTRIDLHLEQEIPTFVGKSRITLFADIENLPNLLNSNWGGLRQATDFQQDVVRVSCLQAPVATGTAPTAAQTVTSPTQPCVQYRYSTYIAPNDSVTVVNNSLYFIRLGARLTF